jgi:hypothetical protein
MPTGIGVSRRVAVRGVVTTADATALQADSQVKPRLARGQALLAAGDLFRKLGELDVVSVRARHGR